MTNEITKLKAEVDRLQAKNLDLKEKLLFMESKCDMLNTENIELKEKLIDYQRFVKAINAQRAIDALEDWFNDDDDDDDDDYTSDNGELNNGIYGLTK